MRRLLACYLCALVDDTHGTCSLCGQVCIVSGRISHNGSYERPHLAVDSAEHSHSKRQQEGHLRMSRLSGFGGFGIDDRGVGAS
jgi:hypothetical protein